MNFHVVDTEFEIIDGLVIAGSFVASAQLGIFTTLLVVIHEIPQELSDFGVLVYGGFSRQKALFYNFLSALTAFIGAILGYFLSTKISGFSYILLSFTAGGFIYIGAADLLPEVRNRRLAKNNLSSSAIFISGLAIMALFAYFE